MAVAERLWPGWGLLALPGWRGLSFSRRRDSSRVRLGCDEDDAALGVRCDDVLGGGIGLLPLVVAVLFIWGEFCVWGVVGVFGDAPLLGRREVGRRALAGEAAAGDCC
jgi:hypothetical protein